MTGKTGTMVIRFVDGTEERLEYAGLPQDDVNMATRIENVITPGNGLDFGLHLGWSYLF
jgi:hypothetical protein